MPILPRYALERLKEAAGVFDHHAEAASIIRSLIDSHLELIDGLKKIRNGLVYSGQYVPYSAVCELVDPLIFTEEELKEAQWP